MVDGSVIRGTNKESEGKGGLKGLKRAASSP